MHLLFSMQRGQHCSAERSNFAKSQSWPQALSPAGNSAQSLFTGHMIFKVAPHLTSCPRFKASSINYQAPNASEAPACNKRTWSHQHTRVLPKALNLDTLRLNAGCLLEPDLMHATCDIHCAVQSCGILEQKNKSASVGDQRCMFKRSPRWRSS